ncbi:hypothetical protein DITRI_Ditri14bG0020100 [Diplodiscus trichospermus]
MKTLKTQYREVAYMLGNVGYGFGLDDVNKCVTCDIDEHKDATGLRNKHFPHFDELAIIFGKDRATGDEVEVSAEAVENIEVEEAAVKAALEAYNAMNVGNDDDGLFNEVNLENFEDSVFFGNTGNAESSTGATRRPAMQSETNVVRKKRKIKKGNGTDDAFLKNMAKLGDVCEGAKEEIGKLATCFQHLVDNAKRKMQLYDVIVAIKGLTDENALKVGAIISTDIDKTNYFFSIPDRMKKLYVQGLLSGSI